MITLAELLDTECNPSRGAVFSELVLSFKEPPPADIALLSFLETVSFEADLDEFESRTFAVFVLQLEELDRFAYFPGAVVDGVFVGAALAERARFSRSSR